jgi:hypothetical protein
VDSWKPSLNYDNSTASSQFAAQEIPLPVPPKIPGAPELSPLVLQGVTVAVLIWALGFTFFIFGHINNSLQKQLKDFSEATEKIRNEYQIALEAIRTNYDHLITPWHARDEEQHKMTVKQMEMLISLATSNSKSGQEIGSYAYSSEEVRPAPDLANQNINKEPTVLLQKDLTGLQGKPHIP